MTEKRKTKTTVKKSKYSKSTLTLHKQIADQQKAVGNSRMLEMIETEKSGHCPKYKLSDGQFDADYARGGGLAGEVDIHEHNSAMSRVYGVQRGDALSILLYRQINATDTSSDSNEQELNGALALIDEMKPRDAFESLLISQMVATYNTAMELIGRGRRTEWADNMERHINYANRLMTTYTKQMQTLAKYRNGGKQTVTVKHVNVEPGGQAIVGDIHQGKGG